MAFDVGAGIAAMGDQVAKVTGVAALEYQKNGLETERLKLANDLAAQRESAGRQETAALTAKENRLHEGFLGQEGDKTRATTLEAHKISAAASMASAGAHLQGIREQIAFQANQPDYKVGDDGTLYSIPKQTKDASGSLVPSKATPVAGADGQPVHVANPERAQAVAKLVETTRDELKSTAQLYEVELKQAQAGLTAALKSPMAMVDSAKDPGVIEAKKEIDAIRQKYEPKLNTLSTRMTTLSSEFRVKAGMQPQGQTYDLNKYIKGGTPAAPETPAPSPGGLIDNH